MKYLRRFIRLATALLRELADEGAYQRHLARHGLSHSREAWKQFHRERLRAKYLRPKCC